MGFKDLLNRIFTKDKKVVICGLDNAGKSTMVSFLQQGTFIEHTPTMGKDQSTIEVQGIRMNLIDMGGQKDFRGLWLGEMDDAQCVLFMVDAADQERFKEAKIELWKLSSIFKKKPLIVLANKYDLEQVAELSEIIEALNLKELPSFEVFPVSCKTGYGLVDAFTKIYYKLTGKTITKKVCPKALTVFDHLGTPLTTKEGEFCTEDLLQGGLLSAITNFVKDSYHSELNSVKMEDNVIVLYRTKHLMGSLIIDESDHMDVKEAKIELKELLEHLENMCPELENNQLNSEKINFLVQQYSTNFF